MISVNLVERINNRYYWDMIFVNFKTYHQGTGEAAVKLAKVCQSVAKKTSLEITPVVQAVDIFRLAQAGFTVWSQHVDDIEPGPNTGQVLAEAVLAAGVKGTILNHSENKIPSEMVKTITSRCSELNIKTMVIAASVEEAREVIEGKPDFLAYEPPEFIGSQTSSVSVAKPEVVKNFVKEFSNLPVLIGAGINNQEDVRIAIGLGAKGVLVSSDVVSAQEPEKELMDLAKGFSQ
ncbi:triose-phosphate isomerase [Patescibacteria group bacterium]